MKAAELRGMDDSQVEKKLAELREELFNLHFQQATRQLTNTARIRQVRKDIARVLTRRIELRRATAVAASGDQQSA